ncbi:MAG: hypothetical protein EBU93_04910 [Chlamydiae bacterium]|nr:hypothetical protein [Chlamydiota bacterium]
MAIDLQQVITILDESLDIDLHLDENQSCKILLNDKISVQIELDPSRQYMIFASEIFILPPGKFREMVLKGAILANYGKDKEIGSFSYLPKSCALMLHEFFPINFIQESEVFDLFARFSTKALFWKDHLDRNTIPQSASHEPAQPNPFGIR